MNLNLTGQNQKANAIRPYLVELKTQMDKRKLLWDKISDDKKKRWVKSEKDPIMNLAWQTFTYLKSNFFTITEDDE